MIQCAEGILERQGAEADFDSLRETALEDEDYALLFDPQWDGVEDSVLGRRLGVAYLHFDEWFHPFREQIPVHPYSSA